MTMDPITQEISHFVGLFELLVEELRLRQDYVKFKFKRQTDDEPEAVENAVVQRDASYDLGSYNPDLDYVPLSLPTPHVQSVEMSQELDLPTPHAPSVEIELSLDVSFDGMAVDAFPPQDVPVTPTTTPSDVSVALPGPGSVAAVVVQVSNLSDNDLFIDGLDAQFIAPAALENVLDQMVTTAEAIDGFEMPQLPTGGAWTDFVAEVKLQLDGPAPSAGESSDGASAEASAAAGGAAAAVNAVAAGDATAAVNAMAAGDAAAAGGAAAKIEIARFEGEDAVTLVVNGEVASEAPEWTDLLPEFLKSETEEAEVTGPEAAEQAAAAAEASAETETGAEGGSDSSSGATVASNGETVSSSTTGVGGEATTTTTKSTEHDFAKDFGDDAPTMGDAPEAGHEVITGGNMAVNEIVVNSKWIDAPVIVVQGDVTKFDAISQVNVLVEHDTVDGVLSEQDSAGYNIAEIARTSSEAEGSASALTADILPSTWQLYRIDADLIQVNWVIQYVFVTDFDRIELTFASTSSYLGLGENQIVNTTLLDELGYEFDLISVAGDMVDGRLISQKNVLFDSDEVVTVDSVPATVVETIKIVAAPDEAVEISSSGLSDPASSGAGVKKAADSVPAATKPAKTTVESTESEPVETASKVANPTTVAEDAATEAAVDSGIATPPAKGGQAGEKEEAAEKEEVADQPEPDLSLADNLLLNEATINTTGIDQFAEMTDSFADAAAQLANGANLVAEQVVKDPLFTGLENLRALQIDGDLIKLNIFEQTNIIGDADQIRARMDALRESMKGKMEMVTGSNALVNKATINEYGVDSTIMAGGTVYDDALIHQAELFDTDALPEGVSMAGLANDAVAAFLSDDMLKSADGNDDIAPASTYNVSSNLDVMETVLG